MTSVTIRLILVMMFCVQLFPIVSVSEEYEFTTSIYDAFQRGNLDDWDNYFHKDVVTNSSANFGVKGIQNLKGWANSFLTAFAPRIDLVDRIEAIDEEGNGRAVITINLNWQHVKPFYGLEPTGRTGTSIENLIMTVKDGKVSRVEVADTTLDLVIYMHEQGWVFPQNIKPEPIIKGIEREVETPQIKLY